MNPYGIPTVKYNTETTTGNACGTTPAYSKYPFTYLMKSFSRPRRGCVTRQIGARTNSNKIFNSVAINSRN